MTDAGALADLAQAAFPPGPGWTAADFARMADDPTRLILTRKAAALIVISVIAPEAEILNIGVAPNHRRQGLGAALLQDAIAALRGRRVDTLFLEVAADNAPARALYARSGFVQVGLRRGYYARAAGRVDGLILRRGL